MVVNSLLAGSKVLVTRPEQQAKPLCDLIVKAGGQAIAFPAIEIVPIPTSNWAEIALAEQDMIIFVSRNAVSYFIEALTEPLPNQILLASVGAGSAASMHHHGLRVDIQPEKSIGSEGLLLMPEFDNMVDKKILIVRGKGGRELLADTLTQRGGIVQYLEVYERVLPSPSVAQCEQALTADYIVCTSVAGVKNLSVLLQKGLKKIVDKPMLVMSERIKAYAASVGFQNIIVTDTSSDKAVVELLTKLTKDGR